MARLCLLISALILETSGFFTVHLVPHFFFFFLADELTDSPMCSAEVWSSVPKTKKAVMCLQRKCVSDTFRHEV